MSAVLKLGNFWWASLELEFIHFPFATENEIALLKGWGGGVE
jgi:hypothetical protein